MRPPAPAVRQPLIGAVNEAVAEAGATAQAAAEDAAATAGKASADAMEQANSIVAKPVTEKCSHQCF